MLDSLIIRIKFWASYKFYKLESARKKLEFFEFDAFKKYTCSINLDNCKTWVKNNANFKRGISKKVVSTPTSKLVFDLKLIKVKK